MAELFLDGNYYQHFLESAEFEYTADEQVCVKNTVEKLIKRLILGAGVFLVATLMVWVQKEHVTPR